tara:strand:- start:324 stop:569 length:246 start_codon:yes stop_codon:yes gene_type:complete
MKGKDIYSKTFEQRKFKRKETLGQYIHRRMESADEVNTIFHLIKVPSADELEYYIQQYKIKEGHSKWSEELKKNIWIEDEE